MRDLIKATARRSWAMSLLGVKSAADLFTRLGSPAAPGQPPSAALDEVAQAAQRQLGGELEALYQTGDRLQSGLVDLVFGGVAGGAAGGARGGPPRGGARRRAPPPPPGGGRGAGGAPPPPPLVHRHDAVQTAANLILGLPAMAQRGGGTFAS